MDITLNWASIKLRVNCLFQFGKKIWFLFEYNWLSTRDTIISVSHIIIYQTTTTNLTPTPFEKSLKRNPNDSISTPIQIQKPFHKTHHVRPGFQSKGASFPFPAEGKGADLLFPDAQEL